MDKRYARSKGALEPGEQQKLQASSVCVIGCGGLGCFAAEELARLGVGRLTLVDADVFEETNLNRQLYADMSTLGRSKVLTAKERIALINPSVAVTAVEENLTQENAAALIAGCDLAIDALDGPQARRILAAACAEAGIFLVHGAISGWRAQITVLPPGSRDFDFLFPEKTKKLAEPSLAFTPAFAASLEVAEAVKLLIGRGQTLEGRLLMIDLLTQEWNEIKL